MQLFTKYFLFLLAFITVSQANIQPFTSTYDLRSSEHGVRYYDPRTSVWQSPDPILDKYMSGMGNNGVYNPINLSLYTYTANNPINLIDPTGKIWGPFEHADHTQTPEQQRQTGSMILDYAPFVGAGKSIQEAATGENIVTGEELSGGDRAWGLLGVIPGGRLVGNGFKWAGDKIGEGFSWAKGLFKTSKIRSVDDVLANPNLLKGKSPEEVETLIGKTDGWKVENLRQGSKKGQGWVMREYNEKGNETGRMLRWHPGSPRKGNKPYWRVNDFETKSEPIFQ